MRNSGVLWFHIWRVLPRKDGSFDGQIDCDNIGKLQSDNLPDAIAEIKSLVVLMMDKAQK